ncbi:hypothetical protein [Citrobacter sedlakii]|uniref:fimbrial biogenesis chaperone n=1 Tax=Citrobacter sedlakii TaxID=67826 RepID=UPI003334EB78
MNSFLHQASFATGYWCYDRHRSVRLVVLVGLAIDQIAQSGLSSLSVIYYSAQLFSKKLTWRREGRLLVVTNPTAIHVNMIDVAVDGKPIDIAMIKPFEIQRITLPIDISGKRLTWHCINDYGAISEVIQQSI